MSVRFLALYPCVKNFFRIIILYKFEYYQRESEQKAVDEDDRTVEAIEVSSVHRVSLVECFETEACAHVCRVSLIQCQPSAHPLNVTRRM